MDKSKYLNGSDKVPDYLRSYIENMRKNTEEFKTQSIRELRNSCDRLSELSTNISEMMFGAIKLKY